MASQDSPDNNAKLTQHPLIEDVVKDPAQPPNVVLFSGFLGRSTQAGHMRLYLTLEMDEYLEIAEGDIVHSQSTQTNEKPLGVTKLWVRRNADIQHIIVQSRTAQAEFIQGEILESCLVDAESAASGLALGGPGARPRTFWFFCRPTPGTRCFICPPLLDYAGTNTMGLCGITLVGVDPACRSPQRPENEEEM